MRLNHFPDDESGNVEYKYKICKDGPLFEQFTVYIIVQY